MSVGTGLTIALVAGAAASAGASIYGAHKQGEAAKTAGEQQQAAAKAAGAQQGPLYQRALDIAQQQAAQGQARLDPYAQQGGAGLTALSSFLGVPQPSAGASAARNAAASPYAATPTQLASAASYTQGAGAQTRAQGVPQTPGPYATPAMLQQQGIAPGSAQDVVTVRSPNGQVGTVPRARVADAIAAGGTLVGA
jgi:hypothetical protein